MTHNADFELLLAVAVCYDLDVRFVKADDEVDCEIIMPASDETDEVSWVGTGEGIVGAFMAAVAKMGLLGTAMRRMEMDFDPRGSSPVAVKLKAKLDRLRADQALLLRRARMGFSDQERWFVAATVPAQRGVEIVVGNLYRSFDEI